MSRKSVVLELNSDLERRYHKEASCPFSLVIGNGKGAAQAMFEWRWSSGQEIKNWISSRLV
jgi:hypothetical protein